MRNFVYRLTPFVKKKSGIMGRSIVTKSLAITLFVFYYLGNYFFSLPTSFARQAWHEVGNRGLLEACSFPHHVPASLLPSWPLESLYPNRSPSQSPFHPGNEPSLPWPRSPLPPEHRDTLPNRRWNCQNEQCPVPKRHKRWPRPFPWYCGDARKR